MLGPLMKQLLIVMALLLIGLVGEARALIIIDNAMKNTDPGNWTMGGNPNPAILTGNGSIDPVGDGWLRLTNASGNQTGFAYNSQVFDLSNGLIIQFDYSTWGGNGADGYSVYLFDANATPFNIGAFGGSLGYAQKLSTATCSPVNPSVPGISGGYVGIGVDEFGNFAYGCEGRSGGASQRPNTVTIRGSVVGFGGGAVGQTYNASSYPWIATSANNGSLWYNGSPRPSQTGSDYRKVIIKISPAPNPKADVWIQYGYNTTPTQMLSGVDLPAISSTQQLKMGYGASTGGSTNYHEIRNLLVTDQNTTTARDMGIGIAAVSPATGLPLTGVTLGSPVRYVITARNYGPYSGDATSVPISSVLPAEVTGLTWSCTTTGGGVCGALPTGATLNSTITLPLNGSVTYTANGTLTAAPAGGILATTAALNTAGFNDYYPSNDSSGTSFTVVPNLSTSAKSWSDLNGGGQNPLDVLRYTITVRESSGVNVSGATVSDTIDTANLTGLTVVSCPAGASCSYGAGVLNVTGLNVPGNGSASIVYDVTIGAGVAGGTTIDNTAAIAYPGLTGVNAVAPTVTVSGPLAAGSGTKQLYFATPVAGLAQTMSRTPLTSGNNYVTLPRGNTTAYDYTWTTTTATTKAITLNAANNGVVMQMRAERSPRTLIATLSYAAGASGPWTAIGSYNANTAITTGATPQSYTLPLTMTGTTIPSGSYIRLTVRNSGTASTTNDVFVYPYNGSGTNGTTSRVELNSLTVINIDSLGIYTAPFNGGSPVGTAQAGSTVYIRAQVSDPFDYPDITSAVLTLKDSAGTTRTPSSTATYTPLTTPAAPAGTKVYEYTYTIPGSGPTGNWPVTVTAYEGTEGVTHAAYATMPVTIALPLLTVVKTADRSNVNPGQVITYTVQVVNTGPGVGTVVNVRDDANSYVALALDPFGTGSPFKLDQGPIPSGLTMGAPAYFSGGAAYTPVSGGGGAPAGYDGNVTSWEIPMTGSMSSGNASFYLTYKMLVK